MQTATMTEMRRHPSPIFAAVRDGEEVIITDNGQPVARLVPANLPTKFQQLVAAGVIRLPERRPIAELRSMLGQADARVR